MEYRLLQGDVRFFDVDFRAMCREDSASQCLALCKARSEARLRRRNRRPARRPITNLINRFYDIADGKIRYDGININHIKKADLRHSLGIVLQDCEPLHRNCHGEHPLWKA